jgi:hypothetical protein
MQHCQCMIQLEAGGNSGHMPFYNSLLSGLRLLLLLEKNMSSSRDLILQQLTTGIFCGFL